MNYKSLYPIRLVAAEKDEIRCLMCPRYCCIKPGLSGFCTTVINHDGCLYSTIYGLIAEYGIDPIEKKPVRCYRPGTRVLSLGSFGCNLRCGWCQNWELAFVDARCPPLTRRYTPHEIIAAAQHSGCQGIAWTYNEPGIWTDFIADCAVVARSVNIYTVLVTNGFLSPECLQLLVPLVDVFRVDLKSLDPQLYQDYAHLKENSPILEAIIHLHRAGAHIELVTVLMPTIIDADHLQRMATWITNELTPDVPWHLTRFVPYARLSNHLPTSHELLSYAEAITHAVGLTRVFVGDWYELEMYG